jgi:hypothetical protein
MRGLEPAHPSKKVFAKKMDRRVKPGGDDFIYLPSCEGRRGIHGAALLLGNGAA